MTSGIDWIAFRSMAKSLRSMNSRPISSAIARMRSSSVTRPSSDIDLAQLAAGGGCLAQRRLHFFLGDLTRLDEQLGEGGLARLGCADRRQGGIARLDFVPVDRQELRCAIRRSGGRLRRCRLVAVTTRTMGG